MRIELGTRVVIQPYAEYRDKYRDCQGVVSKVTGLAADKVGVTLDNLTNSSSEYGVFWFSVNKLTILESEENTEMLKGFIPAGVKFLDGVNTDKEYVYALYDNSLKVGDTVVVKTGHHGLALAQISSIGEHNNNLVSCGREIVDKVDLTAYEERLALRKRVCELKVALDKKVAECQQAAVYEMFAEKDPAMRELLNEYKALLKI